MLACTFRHQDYDGEVTLKLELGDKVLGESDKITNVPSSFVVVEFSAAHVIGQNDYSSLDEVVSKPLICEIIIFIKNNYKILIDKDTSKLQID